MSYEDLIIHLVFHATSKNGFDNGLISIVDIYHIITTKEINYLRLERKSKKLGFYKNLSFMLSLIHKRFKGTPRIDNFKKYTGKDYNEYEDLILLNNSEQFAYKLFSKKNKKYVFSRSAFIAEFGTGNINVSNFLKRVARVTYMTLKTLISLLLMKRYRIDTFRTKAIINYLKDD
tara:strand:- start:532 stop:1056 length:525 start_codon:yes stop_codon:yes gene_type:complete